MRHYSKDDLRAIAAKGKQVTMENQMNPVMQLAREMQTPSAHIEVSNNLANRILAELGAESVQSFNDDDFYTYNIETLELQAGRGAHYERPTQLAAPLKTVRGMTAKYLGLWQYKAEVAA